MTKGQATNLCIAISPKLRLQRLQEKSSIKQFWFLYHHFFCSTCLWTSLHCICEIHCIVLDGFDLDLKTVHWLSSKENYLKNKSWRSRDSNPGLMSGKQECFLCATQPPWVATLVQDISLGVFHKNSVCHLVNVSYFYLRKFLIWRSLSQTVWQHKNWVMILQCDNGDSILPGSTFGLMDGLKSKQKISRRNFALVIYSHISSWSNIGHFFPLCYRGSAL